MERPHIGPYREKRLTLKINGDEDDDDCENSILYDLYCGRTL